MRVLLKTASAQRAGSLERAAPPAQSDGAPARPSRPRCPSQRLQQFATGSFPAGEISSAVRLSPVGLTCPVRRPVFPSASRRGSNHITSTHPSIALVVLCPSLPLLPLHPSSPASPLTAREPAPSAGQGTRLYRTTRTCTLQYTQAHGLTRGQAHQGNGQQSSAGKPAVDSRRRPVRSLPRSPRNTSLSPSQSLVPFHLVSPYATDSVSLARPRPTAPARQARPSRPRSPQGKAEILPIS